MAQTYSKAFKGLKMPGEFKRQRCGHAFRTSGCSVCPVCRTDVSRKILRAKAPPKPRMAPDFSTAAFAFALAGGSEFALAAWAKEHGRRLLMAVGAL